MPILATLFLTAASAQLYEGQQKETYLLVGNIEKAKGAISTDMGTQDVVFRGQIAFKASPDEKGVLHLVLTRLNLLNSGVSTTHGETGVIGLSLTKAEYPTVYSSKDGTLKAKPRLTLHYPLIDRIKGYRSKELNGSAHFVPFTERMKGRLQGKLPTDFQLAKDNVIRFNGKITLALDDGDPGLVHLIVVSLSFEQLWIFAESRPAEILRIQPVFIGSGPLDLTATGVTFDTMIREAADMWNRCGTERCMRLLVDTPMYLNDDAYRVVDNVAELFSLADEVNITDKIEIFVVERFVDTMAVDWGGGGTLSSGTSSAKIVTSDQNLNVPCPEPCTTLEEDPGDNAAMCAGCSDTPRCGDVNYQHLSHELGHVLDLSHPPLPGPGLSASTTGSVMEPSGLCCDNPDVQSARNCRNASNSVLFWDRALCSETPDILD
jgi:hypothetical protein